MTELQSTVEELETTNESILTGVRSGVVVLDRELHGLAWNHRSEDLWGLRNDEVKAQNFLNLDIGLPVENLRADIRACLSGERQYSETLAPATKSPREEDHVQGDGDAARRR